MISLNARMMDLEDNSGTEDCDNELLKEIHPSQSLDREIVYNKNLRYHLFFLMNIAIVICALCFPYFCTLYYLEFTL